MDHVSAIDAMGDTSHVADANYMSGGHDTAPAAAPPVPKKKDRTMLYIFGGAAAAFAAYAAYSTIGAKHAHQDASFAPPAAVQPVAPLVPAAPNAPAAPAPAPAVSTVPNPLNAGPAAAPTVPAAPTVSVPKTDKGKPTKAAPEPVTAPQSTVKVESPTAPETATQAPAQSGGDAQLSTRMDKLEHRVGRIEVAVNRIERAIRPAGRVGHHRKWEHGKHKHLDKHLKKDADKEDSHHKDLAATATADSAIKVQAVTPGRVWIMDIKGETHTYTLGDQLPNGAEIKAINADSGVIETSKGNIK